MSKQSFPPRLGLRGVTLLVILALALAACGGSKKKTVSTPAAQPADATLNVQSAQVEWQSGSAGSWNAVTGTQAVSGKDSIRTNASGQAQLTFYTGTQVDILPNSQVVISSFEKTADGGATITIRQISGDTLHRVQMVADTHSRYEVETPVATLTVRGTEFKVNVAADGATRVEVTSGTVQASIGQQQYDVKPGQAIDVNSQKQTSGPADIKPILPPNTTITPTATGSAPATPQGSASSTPVPPAPTNTPAGTAIPPIGYASPLPPSPSPTRGR